MKTRRLLIPLIAILWALSGPLPAVRALDDWERDRDRYARWIDSQWPEQTVPPATPTATSVPRYQPPTASRQDAYRRHALFGVTNAYYPHAVVTGNGGANGHVDFSPLLSSQRYDRALDDGFCSIFGIDPLDCTCD